jgi:F-type H+-transporting ATPase subunit delta
MLASLIAERYSKALLRAARTEGSLAEVGAQAEALRLGLGGAADAAAFLGDPLTEPHEKLRILTGVFKDGGHPLLRGFLGAVLEHKRERFLPAILAAFARLRDEAEGRATAPFGTARPLAKAERSLIESALSRRLKRTITLEPYTDSNLLGGAVLKLGDTVFDGSIRNSLNRLGRRLAEGPAPARQKTPPKAPERKNAAPGAKAPKSVKGAKPGASAAAPKKAAPAIRAAAKPKKKAAPKKKTAKKVKP